MVDFSEANRERQAQAEHFKKLDGTRKKLELPVKTKPFRSEFKKNKPKRQLEAHEALLQKFKDSGEEIVIVVGSAAGGLRSSLNGTVVDYDKFTIVFRCADNGNIHAIFKHAIFSFGPELRGEAI